MDYMHKHQIGIESCLTSNYQTGTIKDLSNHPIKTFLANGLNVCLNTDDPADENIELKDEFNLATNLLKFNGKQITQLQNNAIEMSFLSDKEKESLRQLKI